jgi:hypothetical protein
LIRAHWTADSSDAQIVAALLRAHGLRAWAFDTGVVRLDWTQTLAFGGCRVMVADADALQARALLQAYAEGTLAFPSAQTDQPGCPHCGGADADEDPRPRRLVFLVLIAAPVMLFLNSPALVAAWMLSYLLLIAPGVVDWLIKWRYRCRQCARSWRAPPLPFRTLARMAADGESAA